jgi:hypothetical protein
MSMAAKDPETILLCKEIGVNKEHAFISNILPLLSSELLQN